jgi:uncharacterized membrane protein YccF (DUF307 family)
MSFLGNVIWLIFGGFLSGLGYVIGGLLTMLTIIGIPLGADVVRLGIATMAPFGKEIVPVNDSSTPNMIFNVLWAIFFGWEIALSHLVHGLIFAITIIGLPFAKQHFKLIPLALFPFGKELR